MDRTCSECPTDARLDRHLGVSADVMRSCPWWLIGVCTSLI